MPDRPQGVAPVRRLARVVKQEQRGGVISGELRNIADIAHQPHDSVGVSIGRDRGQPEVSELAPRLGHGSGRKHAVAAAVDAQRICSKIILVSHKIHIVIPVQRGAKEFAEQRGGDVLNDLIVIGCVIAAHVVSVDQVNVLVLARGDQQIRRGAAGLSRQKDGPAGAQILIIGGHEGLIVRREVIGDGESAGAQVQPQHAIAKVVRTVVENAVRGRKINIAGRIGGGTYAALPNGTAVAVIRLHGHHSGLLQGGGAEGKQPAPGNEVAAIGSEGKVNVAIRLQQPGPLKLIQGAEGVASDGGGDRDRAAEFFRSRGDVESMQRIIGSRRHVGLGGNVQRVGGGIDHRRPNNSQFIETRDGVTTFHRGGH